jgi:hypothetical protein
VETDLFFKASKENLLKISRSVGYFTFFVSHQFFAFCVIWTLTKPKKNKKFSEWAEATFGDIFKDFCVKSLIFCEF